jgi:serine/threonine protein kinase
MGGSTNALVNLKPGWVIGGFTIEEELNRGAFAMAYRARAPGGELVFLKSYKSPTVKVHWYPRYLDYQREMKRRIEGTALKNFCYRIVDFFEARKDGQRCGPEEELRKYFQVFEFVSSGGDLSGILHRIAGDPSAYSWGQRLIWARVIMASIAVLHSQKIVHCDLKPENLYLIEDRSIAAGFRLKLIDMDYSILSDVAAPWHGEQGYAGTPGWCSPEHLRNEIPGPASDVYTSALILGVLLGSGRLVESADFDKLALAGTRKTLRLQGPLQFPDGAPSGLDVAFAEAIHAALDPNPARRPTAERLRDLLTGAAAHTGPTAPPPVIRAVPPKVVSPPPSSAKPPASPPPPTPAATTGALTLTHGAVAETLRGGVNVNSGWAARFGEDARYMDGVCQFALERREDGWWVIPITRATNETLLNGRALAAATRLSSGDVLGIGREAKGIIKLPIQVRI